jgi:hypothetical protein
MKRIALIVAMSAAVSLSAQQATTTEGSAATKTATAAPAAPATQQQPALASAPGQATESPLVKAARRTGAKKSTKKAITNDTLKEMNQGRITTTNNQYSVDSGPTPTPAKSAVQKEIEDAEVKKQRAAAAEKQKQADEAKRVERLRRAAAAAEEGDGWLDGEPGAVEELQNTASTTTAKP